MPGGPGVRIDGLDEFRKELRKLDDAKTWTKELSKVHQTIGREVRGWSRGIASGMGGTHAHFAGAISGGGGVTGAKVGVGRAEANAAFWGAKQRTGWNAGNTAANQPSWVGANWEVGAPGQGPYAMNQAIHSHLDDIIDDVGRGVDHVSRRAFND